MTSEREYSILKTDVEDANRPAENRREPALTVRREARPFYAALFVLQTFALIARRFYISLTEQSDSAFWQALSAALNDGKFLDIAAASLSELERDGAKAVISTIVLMEVWDAMMATRDTVNDWLEKRREKARAEGIAEGIAEGRAEGLEEGRAEGRTAERAKWQAWYSKWEDARARNEPFDEPPPGADDE